MFQLLVLGLAHGGRQLHNTPSTGTCTMDEIGPLMSQIGAKEPSCVTTLQTALSGQDVDLVTLCGCYLHLPWEVGSTVSCVPDGSPEGSMHTLGYDYIACAVNFGVAPPAPPCVCEESWTAPECGEQTLSGCPAVACAPSVHRPQSSSAPWCKHQDGLCAEDMYGSLGWGYMDCTPPTPTMFVVEDGATVVVKAKATLTIG